MCEEAKPGPGIGIGPIAFLLGACLLVSAFGWVLNIIAIGLTVAAVVLVGGIVALTLRHYHRWLNAARVPAWERIGHVQPQRQVPAPRWRPALRQDQQPAAVEQHVHFHGLTPGQIAEAQRQLRGQ